MARLIQYATKASFYNGPFGGDAGWAAAGMGYIWVCDNGHLVVIDGGHDADGEAFLCEMEKAAGVSPVPVDLWILTHPHNDHIGAFGEIMSDASLKKRIDLGRVVYQFPDELVNAEIKEIELVRIVMAMRDAGEYPHVAPTEGDTISLDGTEIRFLYARESCKGVGSMNQLSLIFTLSTADGKKVMICGDAYPDSLSYVNEKYGAELKCDVIQLPHHGLCDTGDIELYKNAAARTVLIPTSEAGNRSMASGEYGIATHDNEFAMKMAGRVYKSFMGTCEIIL